MTAVAARLLIARHGLALALACLGLSGAEAQTAPIRYWMPGGPFGLHGGAVSGADASVSGDAAGFTSEASGFSFQSYSVPVSAFAAGHRWAGLSANAFAASSQFTADGAHYAYSFKGVGGLPVSVFAGVETLRASPDVFTALTSISPTAGATRATAFQAGVEFRPTSNLSLSFSAGYAQQQPGVIDSDIHSPLLPGQSTMLFGGMR